MAETLGRDGAHRNAVGHTSQVRPASGWAVCSASWTGCAQRADDRRVRVDRLLFAGVAVVGGVAIAAATTLAAVFGAAAGDLDWVILGPLPIYLAGAFAFWRRPDHAAVRWLLVTASLFSLTTLFEYWLRLQTPTGAAAAWVLDACLVTTEIWTSAAVFGFFGLFPAGRPERHYEQLVIRTALATSLLLPVLVMTSRPALTVSSFAFEDFPYIRNPLFAPALTPVGGIAYRAYIGYWMVILPLAGIMLALRYRRAAHEQRRQIRWLILGTALGALGAVSWALTPVWLGNIVGVLCTLCTLATVACIVIALLDAGLLDVDVIIRKSLVYATLWLLIALGYVGMAAALGVAATSQLPVSVAIILAIAAAVLFQPARRWLERLAERWVFGEQVSHYDIVTRFGDALEETGDLDKLLPKLAETVRRGLALGWVRVRLDPPRDRPQLQLPEGLAGAGGDPEIVVPLMHAGESVGAIECGPKEQGSFTDADHRLLATLARQAAAVAHNLRLRAEQTEHLAEISRRTAELTESRARVVQAQDAERRRLQRDLHDGIQQSVAALSARLGLARNQLRRADLHAATTLADLQTDVNRLLDELRDLAHSIRPAVLSDRGLLEAVEAHATRLPVPVVIDADQTLRGVRFPVQIEDAAWFGIAEAMTNALKHSDTARIIVSLTRQNGHLEIGVSDNGQGFAAENPPGFGLAALADRMAVLGGHLTVNSAPGHGTHVRMNIPLPAERTA
jgi:signal transduction histidine kinase